MNFQVFHVNPGKKLKKKDVNNNLSHFMSVFPNEYPMGIEWAYHLKNVFGRGAQIVAVKCNQKLSSSVLKPSE